MQYPKWEVADILNLCKDQINQSTRLPQHIKGVAHDLMNCRTAALGGHKLICNQCGHADISYNSCRNRHCPKCQYSKRELWVIEREKDLIPVKYFHVIFTIPSEINKIVKAYPGPLYNVLFKAAWYTIRTLAADPKWIGGEAGMISLLHTWGQNLSLHPHLHCLIPNGAWDPTTRRWIYPKKKRFLFPVRVMSKMFRGKFISLLNKYHKDRIIDWSKNDWQGVNTQIRNAGFNVFSKLSHGGPSHIIQYLARYSHRVAITNKRIIDVNKDRVLFRYKDYRDGKKKRLALTPLQFTQRFLLHVLPKGFSKIRHFGILSNRARRLRISEILYFFERRVPAARPLELMQRLRKVLGENFDQCPICKEGRMLLQRPSSKQYPVRGDPLKYSLPSFS